MRTFSSEPVLAPKCPHETPTIPIDFSDRLAYGEIVQSITTVTATIAQGYDAVPQDLIDGEATRDGSVVSVPTIGGLDGVYYRIEVLVLTDAGRTVSKSVVLPVIEL